MQGSRSSARRCPRFPHERWRFRRGRWLLLRRMFVLAPGHAPNPPTSLAGRADLANRLSRQMHRLPAKRGARRGKSGVSAALLFGGSRSTVASGAMVDSTALRSALSRARLAPAEMLVIERKRGSRCATGSRGMQQSDRPSTGGVRLLRLRESGSLRLSRRGAPLGHCRPSQASIRTPPSGRNRSRDAARGQRDRHDRNVAIGVVRSENTRIVKASPRASGRCRIAPEAAALMSTAARPLGCSQPDLQLVLRVGSERSIRRSERARLWRVPGRTRVPAEPSLRCGCGSPSGAAQHC